MTISAIAIRGDFSSRLAEIFETFGYYDNESDIEFTDPQTFSEFLAMNYSDYADHEIVLRGVSLDNDWLIIHDPEMVDCTDEESISVLSRKLDTEILTFIIQSTSSTYGFSQFNYSLKRQFLVVDGEVTTDRHSHLQEENGLAINEYTLTDDILGLAHNLGFSLTGTNCTAFTVKQFEFSDPSHRYSTPRTAEKLFEVDDFSEEDDQLYEDIDGGIEEESPGEARQSGAMPIPPADNITSDDFDSDRDIQKSRTEDQKRKNIILTSLSILCENLNLREVSSRNLSSFSMPNHLYQLDVTRMLRSLNPDIDLHITIASHFSSFPTSHIVDSESDQYIIGIFKMQHTFPATYIRRETVAFKIADFFLKKDVDFRQSKRFSRKFHVQTENKDQLLSLLQFKDLDELVNFPDLELELHGNTCLYRSSRKAISPSEAENFCDLTHTLLQIFA